MRKGLTTALTAACAMALIAAGCGDDETTTSSTTSTPVAGATGEAGAVGEPLTEDQFAVQGNEICEQGDRVIDQAAEQTFSGGQPSDAELNAFTEDTVIPGIQAQIDGLRSLSAPEEIQDQLTSTLDDAEDILAEAADDPSLLQSGEPFTEINKQLDEIGLTSCADDA